MNEDQVNDYLNLQKQHSALSQQKAIRSFASQFSKSIEPVEPNRRQSGLKQVSKTSIQINDGSQNVSNNFLRLFEIRKFANANNNLVHPKNEVVYPKSARHSYKVELNNSLSMRSRKRSSEWHIDEKSVELRDYPVIELREPEAS